MICIRLECDDGDGIFKCREKGFDLNNFPLGIKIAHLHVSFPNPYEEFGDKFNPNYYCAYKSFGQLLAWIHIEELRELISREVSVYIIEVEEGLIGKYQICYKKKNIIWKKNINNLI
jgi:hypothetical protein